jgi:hypothetical protein
LALCGSAAAETLRIAQFHTELARAGPGLLLRDIQRGDAQVAAVVAVIAHADADVLLLMSIDYDLDGVALSALAERLAQAGMDYPHRFALRPNTGMPTGLDMDGNGRLGEARDAQGFGFFSGNGGMAILSRLPIDTAGVRDFSALLWRDLPGGLSQTEAAVQRLSTTGHWDVPLSLPQGGALHLLAWHATPPVFDGAEDRNGRRNHDETAFWLRLLEGALPSPPPPAPFVLIGTPNLDPMDGDGRREAIGALLASTKIQDPLPKGTGSPPQPQQNGDPALDTATFGAGAGALRVDMILPSAELVVSASGVIWPPDDDPFATTVTLASRHRLVWVDLTLP